MNKFSWDNLAARHHDWVDRMGWHNKSAIEGLGLICSEIGETWMEVKDASVSDQFPYELADIVLRCIDHTHAMGISLDNELERAGETVVGRGPLSEQLLGILVCQSLAINAARDNNTEKLGKCLVDSIRQVLVIADSYGIDLVSVILTKYEVNQRTGARGRTI